MKKVLFVRAVDPISEVESRYPGLGLAYLASALRLHFGEDYFDFKIIERGGRDAVMQQIDNFNPDIIGISSVTQNFNLAKEYADFAKSKNIPVIMGGVHISMLPQSMPKNIDLACIGEGEETIIDIFKLFDENGGLPKEKLADIKGIAFWADEGNLIITGSRPMIADLNSIKMPARDLLEIDKHSYIFSSRGCPYRCSFCASSRFWDKVRLFSAEYVVGEIKDLYNKYGVKMISFYDDLFIISPQRLEDITTLLKKEGLHGKIKFTGSCRSNLVNDKIATLLKEMGVVSVGLGLESGNPRVLNYLKGETTSIDHNRNAVEVLKKHGISVNASFVIGSPDETEAEMMDTYNFIKNNNLDLVDVYVLMPLPGTPVWQYAKSKGLVADDMDWSKLNVNFEMNKKAVLVSELYGRNDIEKIYGKFRRLRLYKNIKNIWHSPFLIDLPKYILKISYGKIISMINVFSPRRA